MRKFLLSVVLLSAVFAVGCGPRAVPLSPQEETRVGRVLLNQYAGWKGVPYRMGGVGKKGVDCSGFVGAVFRDGFGKNLPRSTDELFEEGVSVDEDKIQAGDLLCFSERRWIFFRQRHVGVALDGNRFLHASTSQGVTLSALDEYWRSRLKTVRRVLP